MRRIKEPGVLTPECAMLRMSLAGGLLLCDTVYVPPPRRISRGDLHDLPIREAFLNVCTAFSSFVAKAGTTMPPFAI